MAHIVIIEDNPANLELMSYLLTSSGHQVTTAHDGDVGLELVRHSLPDLIICDLHMPKLDGFQVARLLKGDQQFSAIPLIAVTALAMFGDRERGIAAGFDGYISKPIEPQQFVSAVEQFLLVEHRSTIRCAVSVTAEESDVTTQPDRPDAPKILVVDDRAINREFLVMLLESAGYNTAEAVNGAEALQLAKQEKFSLIISDILMPVMDGIEFANRMHADKSSVRIPIIFYTATYRASEALFLAQFCGVDLVLAKPAEPQVILDSIASLLGHHGNGKTGKVGAVPQLAVNGLQLHLKAAFDESAKSARIATPALLVGAESMYASGNLQSLSLRTAALLELSMALSAERDPQKLLEMFCRAVQDIMSARKVLVGIHSDKMLYHVASCGMEESAANALAQALTSTDTLKTLFADENVLNARQLRSHPAMTALPANHPLKNNCLVVSLVLRSQPFGWLYIEGKLGSDHFNGEDEQFASTLAMQLAPSYENLILFDEVRSHAGELELEATERKRLTEELLESETVFRQLAENIHEVFFLMSENDMQTLYISPAYQDIWGCSPESVYLKAAPWAKFIHPEDKERAFKDYTDRDESGRFELIYRIVRPDGAVRSIRARGFPVRNEKGVVYRLAGIAEDITDQVNQSRRLERINRHYAVLSGVNSAIARIHHRNDLFRETCRIAVTLGGFNTVWVGVINARSEEGEVAAWFGSDESDLNYVKLTPDPNTIFSNLPASRALREKRPIICNNVETEPGLDSIREVLISHNHRSIGAWPLILDNTVMATISFYAASADFFDGEQVMLLNELADDLAFGLNFIGQAEAETRLAQRLTNTLESITDAFIMVDRDWKFTYLNNDAEKMVNCPREEVLGMNIWERFPEAVGTKFYIEYHKAMEQNCTVSFEEYYEPLNLWVEIRAYPSDEGLAIYFADIGKRKAAEAEINTLAFYDKLTSLPNRQLLLNRLDHAIGLCKLDENPGAVLFIDLDNFKSINDTRGHDKGDLLLQQVAKRLTSAVLATDTVARIGGDEYIILLENHGKDNDEVALSAKNVAESVIELFREPFDIAGEPQYSTCSIGIALFDHSTVSFEDVLKRADLAMYQAKATGRNAMSFFSLDMQARIIKRVALESDLRTALQQGEFLLHYQPQIDIDGCMSGVEALVRWNSPVRGLVSPLEFIPICEDTGLILPLGRSVMRTACELLVEWEKDAKTAALTIAVNVSAPQFHHPDFVQQVLTIVQETGINPSRLKLELTESLLVNDITGTINKMNALKKIGILFSLDDFGTGYSSLSYLHRLPLDQLKIDQSFIRDALNDENAAVIARTVLALGKALNLNVIAEGVETTRHLEFIQKEGCQEYQGYLFSKPLPVAELTEFIEHAKTREQLV
jgi:diguanylate cyclase (GGDEF)-like protein/PAS domain S-box-containing protein